MTVKTHSYKGCPISFYEEPWVYLSGNGWAWRVDYVGANGFASEVAALKAAYAFLDTCEDAP